MASPLKLKSERVGKLSLADQQPYLSVLVDTGVFHLDQTFDYALPSKFDLQPGSWVSVPFHGKNCLGLVTDRKEQSNVVKTLPINRTVIGPFIDAKHLKLYKEIASRWCVPIFDVLRFVTKYRSNQDLRSESMTKPNFGKRLYLQLPPNTDELTVVKNLALKMAKKGPTLLIVPEERLALEFVDTEFEVAMRGGILSPKTYANLIVLREESENHFELKSPGFNTRDVALLRNEILSENVFFVGYSPSLEMTRLIEMNFVDYRNSTGELSVEAKASQQGELIPSALLKSFKNYLLKGPVLVIVPSKGYGLALSCASCRNIAKCSCGGKLTKTSKKASPTCVICKMNYMQWSCNYCQKNQIYLLGRGIERIAEDFGKTFVNTQIHIATAEKKIVGYIPRKSIVLSTVGAAPLIEYSAVLFLEGLNLGADMRSEERFLSTLFRYTAYASGKVMLVERPEHPAVNALVKWNTLSFVSKTLSELKEAHLPPFTRHALIKSEESERIYRGILSSIRDNRLPINVKIHNLGSGVLSIFFDIKSATSVLDFLYQFQKRRSISGKAPLKVRIDPYLLG